MSLNKTILYLCFPLLISSCATLKSDQKVERKIELKTDNLHLINGTYQNNESNVAYSLDYFWGSYYKTKEFRSVYKLESENTPYYIITLKVLNKNKVNATIKVNDTILKSYVIKGRIKNGYFEQNRKWYVIPALLFNEFHSSKFRIGLLEDSNLITDSRKIEFGTVYFFSPFDNSESHYNVIHDRITPLNLNNQ